MLRKALLASAAAVLLIAVVTFPGSGAAQDLPVLKVRHSAPHVVAKLIRQMKSNAAAARKRALRRYGKMVAANRRSTWYWQEQALRKRSRTNHPERWMKNPALLRQRALLWKRRARQAYRYAINPPHKVQWLCIHDGFLHSSKPPYRIIGDVSGTGEGSWTDSGDPYWGGLQMDKAFMRAHAPAFLLRLGWANSWTPLQQMWVAENALKHGVSFHAWPLTAAACGYI